MSHFRKRRLDFHSLSQRVGHRGGSLLTFAFIDFVIAYSLLDPQIKPHSIPAYRVVESLAPYWFWSLLWGFAGIVCVIQAFARVNDRYGFAVAMYIKIVWAGCFAAASIGYHAYRAWVAAATWFVFALFVLLISGWAEPTERDRK